MSLVWVQVRCFCYLLFFSAFSKLLPWTPAPIFHIRRNARRLRTSAALRRQRGPIRARGNKHQPKQQFVYVQSFLLQLSVSGFSSLKNKQKHYVRTEELEEESVSRAVPVSTLTPGSSSARVQTTPTVHLPLTLAVPSLSRRH